ncbi:hypothetical protein HIM_04390 [Hirsutella minnesotensis 3608]|uniref:Uncharacterized protein n=1 Tax=Hirsutella minnesotensis 3608 TaxID=1043627 RepID=A0A0F7ZVB2_9HYPO|nr:hypothetical protein HIM_04390 [Hirsutella minnesotensis 3608]
MTRPLILLASLAGAVTAVLDIPFGNLAVTYSAVMDSVAASVVNADENLATLAVQCTHSDSRSCLLPYQFTVIVGTKTAAARISDPTGAGVAALNCDLNPDQDVASCGFGAVEPTSNGQSATETPTVRINGYKSVIQPMRVTAGAEKLSAAPSALRAFLAVETAASDASATRSGSRADADKKPSPTRLANNNTVDSTKPLKNAAEPVGAHKVILATIMALGFAMAL